MKTPCNSLPKRCVTLWFVLLAFCTQAQTKTPPSGVRGAIIIGISQYKEVTPLQFADKDAVAFAEFLKTQQVPEDNIKLFLNEEATRFNIVDELYTTSQQLKKGDKFFFYFGGHGDLEAKIGYENSLLLLYNSFKKNYFQGNEYLQLSELKTWFGALTQKGVEVIFIADACHSGGLIGGKEGNTKTQRALQESWEGITKILSSKADEFSLEGKQWGGGRGIFSYHLVNGLTGRADANKDQKVSLGELSNYLTTNVVKEANPNIQTPVVMGNSKQFLSKVSKEGLAKLADYEKRNFPIITEVNLKGGEERDNLLISKLDTTLVYTYKQFIKAVKQKKLNTFDDSTNYALLHYRKLVARKIPDHVVQRMKRSLGAALMERELDLMQEAREKGSDFVIRLDKMLAPAIRNLEETMQLFGSNHYSYNFLQARKLVLESRIMPKEPQLSNSESNEQNLQKIQTYFQNHYLKEKKQLIKGLQLEPNMISTYALLASSYRDNQQPDSAIYYQEKVVELLPNQGYAYLSLASSYQAMTYIEANNKSVPHPKAITNLERAIALDSTLEEPYRRLGSLSMGSSIHDAYHDYPKAIRCYEKLLSIYETADQELLKHGLDKYLQGINATTPRNTHRINFIMMLDFFTKLHILHKVSGDSSKSETYLNKFSQKVEISGLVKNYADAIIQLYMLFQWGEYDIHLKKALDFQQHILSKIEEEIKTASVADKPLLTLQYRELLKGMGAIHRALKNYSEAENYFQQALAYPVLDGSFKEKLKLTGSYGINYQHRIITLPNSLQKQYNGDYHYRIDVNTELFFLKWEQNKPDEAFAWLEKAFQVSLAEHGNDISGKPFEESVLNTYPTIDQARFKALKAKYFPPASNEKK